MHSKQSLAVLVAVLVVIAIFGIGCSSSSPSGPDSIVGDLWIGGAYYYYPDGGPTRATNGALVIVRDGGETGPVVSGLTVKIGGATLAYQQATGYYTGLVPGLVSGQDVRLSVSDGLGTTSKAVQVPFALSDLSVDGGAWDITSLFTTNTVRWDNPTVVGQELFVFFYDYVGSGTTYLGSTWSSNAYNESVTVSNSLLNYYSSISTMRCVALQVNRSAFANHPTGSEFLVLAGDWADWPVVSRGASDTESDSGGATRGGLLIRTLGEYMGQPN